MPTVHRTILTIAAATTLAACGASSAPPANSSAKSFSCAGYPQLELNRATHCESREFRGLGTSGQVAMDLAQGAIRARGEPRPSIDLLAYVYAQAATEERAREIASRVVVHTANDDFRASGPQRADEGGAGITVLGVTVPPGGAGNGDTLGDGESWWVDFDAALPARIDLAAHSTSGGVELSDLAGTIDASSTSGDVRLAGLAGQVHAADTSGNLTVDLGGLSWTGEGFSAGVTSGDVTFRVPAGYSARFELQSTSGAIESDFGGTPSSQPGSRRLVETTGSGGVTLYASTTSGDIALRRK